MKTIKLFFLMVIVASLNLSFVESIFSAFVIVNLERIDGDPVDEECSSTIEFSNHIQPILKANCTSAGCHVGNGTMKGNFMNYESVMNYIKDDGQFKIRLIDRKDMPPAYSPGMTSLSKEDIQSISCWIKQGYPS